MYLNLELVQVFELLPLLALQLVLLLQSLYSTAGRVPSVLQGSSSEKRKVLVRISLSGVFISWEMIKSEAGVQ